MDGSDSTGSTEATPPDADRPRKTPPELDGHPVVGNALQFLGGPFEFYDRCRAADADVVAATLGPYRFNYLTHPEYVERVLVTDDELFVKGELMEENVGQLIEDGVLVSEGESWRRQRELLQPAFYRERIVEYADVMARYARERVAEWDDGEVLDLNRELQQTTMRILARTMFGLDTREHDLRLVEAAAAITNKFDMSSPSMALPDWVPTRTNRRYRWAVEHLQTVLGDLVDRRRADDGSHDDLLALLLAAEDEAGDRLSASTLRDELVTFVLEGYGTTALGVTYAWYLLSRNPGVAEELFAEVEDLLGNDPVKPSDLSSLPTVRGVVEESLRLYPPVHTIYREATTPVEFGEYALPEGSVFALPQYVVHRDPRWYDDPEAFRPGRWTDAADDRRPEYAYFPFGGGPRHCLGLRFAMMEMQIVVATMAQHVRLSPVDDDPVELSMALTTQPADPIRVRVEKR